VSIFFATLALFPLAVFALESPEVQIEAERAGGSMQVSLTWPIVPGAEYYDVYGQGTDPYGQGILLARVIDHQFFYIVAGNVPPGFVQVPPGTFTMGQPGVNGNPEHEVTLTHGFYLGTYEVTNEQYREALQWAYDNGHVTANSTTVQAYGQQLVDLDHFVSELAFSEGVFSLLPVYGGDYQGLPSSLHPAKPVSWYGYACYCDWRSLMEGIDPFYQGDWDQDADHNPYEAPGYRMPTEAEWEYAARFNDGRTYPWGDEPPDCDFGNFSFGGFGSCVDWSAPVGTYPAGASELGLLDLFGNSAERTGDWMGDLGPDPVEDPLGPAGGEYRLAKGGSWVHGEMDCRCAERIGFSPGPGSNVGFRLCRTAP